MFKYLLASMLDKASKIPKMPKVRYSYDNRGYLYNYVTISKLGKDSGHLVSIAVESGGLDSDDYPDDSPSIIRLGAGKWVVTLAVPLLNGVLKPKAFPSTYNPKNTEYRPLEYSIRVSDEYTFIRTGFQDHNGSDSSPFIYNYPWLEYRFIRTSLYNSDLTLHSTVWNQPKDRKYTPEIPEIAYEPLVFKVRDKYDGAIIPATAIIEEREWRLWKNEALGFIYDLFNKPLIRRQLWVTFNDEVGSEKGSWKGGTTGCGFDMLPNELPLDTLRRISKDDVDRRRVNIELVEDDAI